MKAIKPAGKPIVTRFTARTLDQEISDRVKELKQCREFKQRFEQACAEVSTFCQLDVLWERKDSDGKFVIPLYYCGAAKSHEEFRSEMAVLRRAFGVREITWSILAGIHYEGVDLRDSRPRMRYAGAAPEFELRVDCPWVPTGCEIKPAERHQSYTYQTYRVQCPMRMR